MYIFLFNSTKYEYKSSILLIFNLLVYKTFCKQHMIEITGKCLLQKDKIDWKCSVMKLNLLMKPLLCLTEGVQLLCLIDKGLDASRYLQTYGAWHQAAWLAKVHISQYIYFSHWLGKLFWKLYFLLYYFSWMNYVYIECDCYRQPWTSQRVLRSWRDGLTT